MTLNLNWPAPRRAAARLQSVPESAITSDDLQAATIELMHSVARLAVATFAYHLVERANENQLYEFANIITNALHDYSNTGR